MIKNSEDANKYYELVNKYIDNYVEKWKVKPQNLKKYLDKERLSRFIERNGLKEVLNINTVINDVISDRISMEKDNVMKFESFLISESSEFKLEEISQCLYSGMGKSNIEHEKILADYFDVSLSQIDVVDSDLHKFKAITYGPNKVDQEYIVYTSNEIEKISENIKTYSNKKSMNQNISIDLGGIVMKLNTNSFIDTQKIDNAIGDFVSNNIMDILTGILNCKKNFTLSNGSYIGVL